MLPNFLIFFIQANLIDTRRSNHYHLRQIIIPTTLSCPSTTTYFGAHDLEQSLDKLNTRVILAIDNN